MSDLRTLLKKAQKKQVAIGAFNVYNLETAQAVLQAAEELNSPVIIQTSPKAINYAGLNYLAVLIKELAEKSRLPIIFHLDHGLSIELVEQCLKVGYNSIMIDGSHLPFLENIELTKRVVEIARRKSIPIEGELGTLSGEIKYTNPEEVSGFVKKTGIDSLAVAIGSSHGHAPKEELNLELLEKIRKKTALPLVLHGASGVSDPDIRAAIQRGVVKINIDTQLREVFTGTIKKILTEEPKIIDPRDYLKEAREAVKKAVEEKMLLFGSVNV